MTTFKEKTIKSLFWRLLERGGSQLVSLIVQIVMARLLTPEDFGQLALLLIFVNVGNMIVMSGLHISLVQTSEITDEDCSTVFWITLGVGVVLYVIIFLCAPFIADYYGGPALTAPLRVLTLVLIISSYPSIIVSRLQHDLNYKTIFKATLAGAVCSGIIGISAALLGAGLWALVVQQVAFAIFSGATLVVATRWFPKFEFSPARGKALFTFGWKVMATSLIDTLYQSLTDSIIGKQFGSAELGIVSQGKKYPQALGNLLDGTIQPVMLAATARQQDNIEQVKRLVRRALKTSTFLIFPAMAAFAMVAQPLVLLLLGEKWLPAVPFLQIFCFIFAIYPVHTANLNALNGIGRSDIFLKLEIIKRSYGLIILLLAAFVLQNVYAVVIGLAIECLISCFVNAVPNSRIIDYSPIEQARDILPALVLALLALAVCYPISLLVGLGLNYIIVMLIQLVAYMLVYLVLVKLFKLEEATYLLNTLRDILTKGC